MTNMDNTNMNHETDFSEGARQAAVLIVDHLLLTAARTMQAVEMLGSEEHRERIARGVTRDVAVAERQFRQLAVDMAQAMKMLGSEEHRDHLARQLQRATLGIAALVQAVERATKQ